MKLIPLTQSKYTQVDDSDYPELSKYKWQYHMGYAKRGVKCIKMHRQLLKVPEGMEIDHINRDKLDNRRSNLRICKRVQNVKNVEKRKDSTNTYKGVLYITARKRWTARIQVDGKRIHSGYFKTEIEAAKRYDELATKHHGVFASLNSPVDRVLETKI